MNIVLRTGIAIFNLLLVGGFLMAQQPLPPVLPQPAAVPPGAAPQTPPPPQTAPVPLTPASGTDLPLRTLLQQAARALETARQVVPLLQAGRLWTRRAPGGETELKGALLYRQAVVGVVRFHPLEGTVLPQGLHPRVYTARANLAVVEENFRQLLRQIQLAPAGEYREPEACWVFPLSVNGLCIAELKIYSDGIHVVPDYVASQEMAAFGQ